MPSPRSRAAVLAALATALIAFGARAAVAPYRAPDPTVRRLDNGVTVAVFVDRRLPIVQVQLTVPAGSADERPDQPGAARLTAQMLERGTTSRSASAYAADVDRLGAALTTSSGRDYASIAGAFLARDLEAGFELLTDAVVFPVFSPEEFAPARTSALRAIGQQLSNAGATADDVLWQTVYEGHPYARPPQGQGEPVSALTPDVAPAFYRTHWTPDRAVLAIAGDVDPERAFALAQQTLGKWTGKGEVRAAVKAAAPKARVVIVDRPDLEWAELRVGEPGPRRGDVDEAPITIAARILDRPAEGRLRATVWGPGARATNSSLRDGGLFWIGGAVPIDSVGVAVAAARSELTRLARGAPEREIAEARRTLVQSIPLALETLSGLVAQWSGAALFGLPANELSRLPQRIDSVSASGVAAAAGTWLKADRLAIVAVGPAARLEPLLAGLGPVAVVTLRDLAGKAPASKPLAAITPENEKRGREIVGQAMTAHGGLKKLQGIKSSTVEASANLLLGNRQVPGTLEQIRLEPYRMVYVTKFSDVESRQVLNGRTAWSRDPSGGTSPVDSMSVEALRNGFGSDVLHLLLEASAADTRVGALGRDTLEDRAVDKVEVRPASGGRRTLMFDAATHRLVAMEQDEAGGTGLPSRRLYNDYRDVDGIPWPYGEVRQLAGERVMEIRYTRVAFNTDVDEALFDAPEQPLPAPSR